VKELANDGVTRFISAHARPAVVTGQLSRWRDGVCPVITGLSQGLNAFISARISAIASNVGAPHPTVEHCKPNVHIFFTTEPDKLMEDVKKRAPALLGFHYPQQAQRMATFSHPIQGWYVTATQGDDGTVLRDDAMPIQLGTPRPESVTAGDLAFLHALYSTDLREGLSLEQSDIQDNMMREFSSYNR
jgi:hypothetical protein